MKIMQLQGKGQKSKTRKKGRGTGKESVMEARNLL